MGKLELGGDVADAFRQASSRHHVDDVFLVTGSSSTFTELGRITSPV